MPEVAARLAPLEGRGDDLRSRVVVEARGVRLPIEPAGPAADTRRCSPDEAASFQGDFAQPLQHADHLGFSPVPEKFLDPHAPEDLLDQHIPIGHPAYPFSDTRFPWSCFGRVTSGGYGSSYAVSGVMVGPRHLLTSSRIVGWTPGGPAQWLNFVPAYSFGVAPFGGSWAVRLYHYTTMRFHTPSNAEGLGHFALDYVVAILAHRIGESTGWLGWAPWFPAWQNLPIWMMVSYSLLFSGGEQPVFQEGFRILQTHIPPGGVPPSSGVLLEHTAQMADPALPPYGRENASPIFGWFGEAAPRVIALHSAPVERLPRTNPPTFLQMAASGDPLVWLIARARGENP